MTMNTDQGDMPATGCLLNLLTKIKPRRKITPPTMRVDLTGLPSTQTPRIIGPTKWVELTTDDMLALLNAPRIKIDD